MGQATSVEQAIHMLMSSVLLLVSKFLPTMIGKFKLDKSIALAPLDLNSDFSNGSKQSDSLQYGDYALDVAEGKHNMSWNFLSDMKSWLKQEEENKVFELWLKE